MSVKTKWLIKSDYKILGPYTYEQVEDLVMKRQISLIDEIRDMDLRWSYVREVPDFKPLVDRAREEIDSKSELTQTVQTVTSQRTTTTGVESGTITGSHRMDFSLVELPGMNPGENPPVETPKKETSRKVAKPPFFEKIVTPESSKRGLVLNFKMIIAALVLVLCAGGAWYYFNSFSQSKNDKIIFQQIRKYNLYAQDDKSIELFKKLLPASQDKIAVDIIPIWLKLETAGALSSNRMLDLMAKGKVIGNERKSQYQLVKFNKAFNLGDFQNAKDALVKAIDLNPSAIDVKENNALLSFLQKKYLDSALIFKNLYDTSNCGRYLYGHILSLIKAKALNGPVAFQMIEKHIRSRVDFNKELLFLQIYVIKKGLADSPDLYRQYFGMFLDFPHLMTKYFKMSSLVNRTSYNWEDLENIRQELTQVIDQRDAAMMNINFALEKGDLAQAQEIQSKNKNFLNESDLYNLDVAFSYLKKSYQTILRIPTDGNRQSLASQLYMLIMHVESKSSNSIIMPYINMIMKDKPLFSNWAILMTAKMPDDKEQMKTMINGDRIYNNDFLPYLEFKASAINE